jgi:hypothetical protein
MLALSIAVPVIIANVVLLVFFVPYGAAWDMICWQTAALAAATRLVTHPPGHMRHGTARLMFLACLVPHPFVWLSLLHGGEAGRPLNWAASALPALLFGAGAWYAIKCRPKRGCCAKCNYDLTGNVSGRCPECGTPIPGAPLETWTEPEDEAKP